MLCKHFPRGSETPQVARDLRERGPRPASYPNERRPAQPGVFTNGGNSVKNLCKNLELRGQVGRGESPVA